MLNATKKQYQKHEYSRINLLATQIESLNRKFYTVQYVKKIKFSFNKYYYES